MSFGECKNVNTVNDYQDPEIDGRTFSILKDIFGSVTEEIVIKEVLASSNGNLSSSIECLMRITNTNELSLNKDTVSLPTDECATAAGNNSNMVVPTPIPKEVASATHIMLSYSQTAGHKANNQLPTANNNCSLKNNNPPAKAGSLIGNNARALKAIEDINKGYLVMVLMRGLPGSGKSTIAKQIIDTTVKEIYNNHIFSTDDYFMTRTGYRFVKSSLDDAHLWNQQRVKRALLTGTSPVIVDNTNTQIWEMQAYVINASENGYILHVVESQTSWAFNPNKLVSKNSHGVPLDNISSMLYRYEKGLTPESLFSFYKCHYPLDKTPPIFRTLPKPVTPRIKPQVNTVTSQMDSQNLNKSVDNNGQDVFSKSRGFTVQRDLDITQNIAIRAWNDSEQVPMLDHAGAVNIIESSQTNNVNADAKDSPKARRSVADKRKSGRPKLFTSESVNWEPFCPSTSYLNVTAAQRTDDCFIPHVPLAVEYTDSSTNTQCFDIKPENWNAFSLLTPVSRNINSSYISPKIMSPRLKLSLDKGTMTSDEEDFNIMAEDSKNKAEHLKNMKAVFSHIPENYLKDILERCNGDFNWAVEILLDGETENGFIYPDEEQQVPETESQSVANSLCWPLQSTLMETLEDEEAREKTAHENACLQEKCVSEESVNLKKHIEDNFTFSDDHYSEHVLKLRRKIHGTSGPKCSVENENKNTLIMSPEPVAGPSISKRSSSESSEEVTEEEDNVVSVTVGNEFIQSLQQIYGASSCDHPLEPVIHMPLSLLNQIHALWMESLYNQIDVQREYLKSIIKEDEDFARKLEAKEKEEQMKGQPQPVPNLREIMDMEVALAQYKVDISDWKKETPDDMASRLSRQKLLQLFPDIDPEVVLEVLNAHNNNFDQTCQSLLVSTGRIPITQAAEEGLKSIQPLLMEQERDLLARANREQQTVQISSEVPSSSTSTEFDGKLTIKQYRDQAVQHLEIRKVYLNKAMEYYNRGMTQAAAYYSQMAHLHTKKHDYINNLAASEIMEANTSTKNDYTLDLHSLYVAEARQVLDMFLDKHIQQLRERGAHHELKLFLITGRGLHSPKMHARIKPAVIVRLKARQIRYREANPGLLCIVVSGLHLLTDAIADTSN